MPTVSPGPPSGRYLSFAEREGVSAVGLGRFDQKRLSAQRQGDRRELGKIFSVLNDWIKAQESEDEGRDEKLDLVHERVFDLEHRLGIEHLSLPDDQPRRGLGAYLWSGGLPRRPSVQQWDDPVSPCGAAPGLLW